MISNIQVKNYKKYLGKNEEEHQMFKVWFNNNLNKLLTEFKGDTAKIFNLIGEYHEHTIGYVQEHIIIFINGTKKGATPAYQLKEPLIINGKEYSVDGDICGIHGGGRVITSDNDIPIAEFHHDYYQLNILFDVTKEYNNSALDMLSYILTKLNKILEEENLVNSWIKTKRKGDLINIIKERTTTDTEKVKRNLKSKIEDDKNRLNEYKRNLKEISDRILLNMKQLAELTDDKDKVVNKIIGDLNLIAENKLIKDVRIVDNIYEIYTHDLIIIDDKDRRFKGGNFVIIINLQYADIKFKGSEARKSFWSNEDIHPHISNRGEACFGNILSTIAELCSQNELYALVLILLDFLQSTNTSDPAGENIIHWQQIDEDGNEIESEDGNEIESEESYIVCDSCGETFDDEDDLYTVYEGYDRDGELYGEHLVCYDCRDNYYNYDEDIDEYIKN